MADALLNHIICILILGVLLLGIILQKNYKNKISNKFIILIISVIVFLFANFLCYIFEGKQENYIIIYILNWLVFVFADVIVLSFTSYLKVILEHSEKNNKMLFNFIVITCITSIVINTFLTITGNLFIVENGYYIESTYVFLPYLFSLITMGELIAIILINRKFFTKTQLVVILLYEIIPVIPIIIELYTDIYTLTGSAITLSIVLIYIIIQNSTIESSKIREAMLEELSNKDLLTNLNNRRAYYNLITNISDKEKIGVMFLDMNRLKYTNDHFGHKAGDELIINFSCILTNFIDKKYVYRISGDEFVIIIPTDSDEYFNNKAEELKAILKNNNNISALGCSYGYGKSIERLVQIAETRMYIDKENYQKKN